MSAWGWRARSIVTWTIVALVVLAGAALFVFSNYFLTGRRQAAVIHARDLKVGDCLQERFAGDVLPPTVKKTQCTSPHFGEVFAILTVPETQDYPGDEALKRFGHSCGEKFFEYAPNIPDGPTFPVIVGHPTAEAWTQGDRSIICVAMSKGERWASIRG